MTPIVKRSLSPTFGVQVNFHLLPFLSKNKNCRWDLYLTAKYGAAYLIQWNTKEYIADGYAYNEGEPIWRDFNYSRYRHEFGVGVGGGVYFRDFFGLYAEGMVGQYSYFPEIFRCNLSFRGGMMFKIPPKNKTVKEVRMQSKNYWRAENKSPFSTFDFSQKIHSFGAYFGIGILLPGINRYELKNMGLDLICKSTTIPKEFNFRYSLMLKKGWGFTVELPINKIHYVTEYFKPVDTLPNGEIGYDSDIFTRALHTYSIGISLKASYLAKISKRMYIQPEMGLKFMPFIRSPKKYLAMSDMESDICPRYFNLLTGRDTVLKEHVWMKEKVSIPYGYYFVPDLTFAVNFILHAKNPNHNFIFGINGNICFVNRVQFEYQTTNELPPYAQTSGKYGWRTSSIALHLGYQFMKGKVKEVEYFDWEEDN
ncbi:MAG: hypothetical protein LBR36_07340 [Bacteroidales bacterium]|nr:hypothetical protein [Bacteroidales bacterium]